MNQRLFLSRRASYSAAVSSGAYQVRRATLEDLPALRELWKKTNLPLPDLEKRFTEVQIAETLDGQMAGALGIKIERLHGHLHSEAVLEKENLALYEAFWQRMQILARNYGLFRLWTESQTPYWQTIGFKAPSEKEFEKKPAGVPGAREQLLTLALKEESAEGLSVEQQFEIFTQSQKAETERLLQQAQVFKKVAYGILFLACGAFVVAAFLRWMKFLELKKKR
jgi:N-acetylglutamate synthase-like GNAT family acetyltransferase